MPTPLAPDALFSGVPVSECCQDVGVGKLECFGYPVVKKIENTITRFDRIRECERQTDSQTDAARRHKPRFHSISRQNKLTEGFND